MRAWEGRPERAVPRLDVPRPLAPSKIQRRDLLSKEPAQCTRKVLTLHVPRYETSHHQYNKCESTKVPNTSTSINRIFFLLSKQLKQKSMSLPKWTLASGRCCVERVHRVAVPPNDNIRELIKVGAGERTEARVVHPASPSVLTNIMAGIWWGDICDRVHSSIQARYKGLTRRKEANNGQTKKRKTFDQFSSPWITFPLDLGRGLLLRDMGGSVSTG